MKKRVVLVLVAIFLVLAGIGGTKKVVEMRQEAQKERQIAFLKTHEKEMTEYIKDKNPKSKISYVRYDWQSFKVSDSGAFTKKLYSIHVDLYSSNNEKVNGGKVIIFPNNIANPTKINELATNNFDMDLEVQTDD
ncbi:hypothetical protein [Ligilactobacillus murinus]|jgi:hypothetical protein|uniref:Uncharacterized protein n=1 Tax=Ligilactobacillus murinus TaxID=1622 RepID=A0A4Q2AVF4_9LACO|nr:hypothetical protein [Ligilactobacillus murinus]NBH86217.1 hypothetical protein [Lachnospiraceae bacterium]GFI64329.1 hypothetical protein IMSAG117_01747 [Lactobacillaceae bacterium]MBF0700844.1 hypothetical protein [Ligilactobacillus murinus]MCZ0673735.1 hypothetical protein [Ligilactobacillus murinus]MCZ0694676.1 hypothetical protein [Ligilactobacillus murinus]